MADNRKPDYESMWKKFRMYLQLSRGAKEACSITSVTGDHPRPCWAKDQIQQLIEHMDEMEAEAVKESDCRNLKNNLRIVSDRDGKFASSATNVTIKRYFPDYDISSITPEDFKSFNTYPSLYDSLIYEHDLKRDRILFDAMKELLGCRTAYDIYIVFTTEYGINQINSIKDIINKRLVENSILDGIGTCVALASSTDLYTRFCNRFQEVYAHESGNVE